MAEGKIIHIAGLARSGTPRPLEERVAIVTGSTSGIGLGIATALAADGASIVINGFGDHAEIDNLCHVVGARHDVPTRHDAADLSDPDAVVDMVDRTVRAFGPVDILVNNAGIQHVAPIDEFPPEKWDAILAINLSAVFHATRAVLPEMKERRWGRIAGTVSFLCGPMAGSITGAAIAVGGGSCS